MRAFQMKVIARTETGTEVEAMQVSELIAILRDQSPDAEVELARVVPVTDLQADVTVDRYSVEGLVPWVDDEEGVGDLVIWLVGGDDRDVTLFLDSLEAASAQAAAPPGVGEELHDRVQPFATSAPLATKTEPSGMDERREGVTQIAELRSALRDGGTIAIFGESPTSNELVQLFALSASDRAELVSVAGDIDLFPSLYWTKEELTRRANYLSSGHARMTYEQEATFATPYLASDIRWHAIVDHFVTSDADVLSSPDLGPGGVALRYSIRTGDPFDAIVLWCAPPGAGTGDRLFWVFAFNAGEAGDSRQGLFRSE